MLKKQKNEINERNLHTNEHLPIAGAELEKKLKNEFSQRQQTKKFLLWNRRRFLSYKLYERCC